MTILYAFESSQNSVYNKIAYLPQMQLIIYIHGHSNINAINARNLDSIYK